MPESGIAERCSGSVCLACHVLSACLSYCHALSAFFTPYSLLSFPVYCILFYFTSTMARQKKVKDTSEPSHCCWTDADDAIVVATLRKANQPKVYLKFKGETTECML